MEVSPVPSRPVSPVDRAFYVLQVVVAASEPLGVREIGRRTGLPRSTASRLVAALEHLGMVERTADALVAPGSALATLQPANPESPMLLRDQLRPLLQELTTTFGENAALAIDDGDALLYLGQSASDNPVSVDDVSGQRHPFHLVAPGLLAMSMWDKTRLDDYLAGPLVQTTSFSVVDPARIKRRLGKIRKDGFAWTNQELDIGVNGLAVAISDSGQATIATVSIYGPSYRLSPKETPNLARDLLTLVEERSVNFHHGT